MRKSADKCTGDGGAFFSLRSCSANMPGQSHFTGNAQWTASAKALSALPADH